MGGESDESPHVYPKKINEVHVVIHSDKGSPEIRGYRASQIKEEDDSADDHQREKMQE